MAKNLANSLVFAGGDLGADFALGGTDANADRFATGTIGAVSIADNVTAGVIAAGLDPVNGVLKDGDDEILNATASSIASFTVKGTAGGDSLFATGKFEAAPQIGAARIAPATDLRFFVG